MSRTRFVETEVLLAALERDEDEVRRLVNELLPSERQTLLRACDTVCYYIAEAANQDAFESGAFG